MALASRLVRVRHGLGRLGHPCLVPRYPAAPTSTHAEARCHCRSPRFGGRCHRGSGRTISTDAASALKPPTPEEMGRIHTDIMTELTSANKPLEQAARYYFDGAGKLMRPYIVTVMGRACRDALPPPTAAWPDQIERDQIEIAKITEMIHTASLVHDDVIDEASTRRAKSAVNVEFTAKECVLAGNAILAKATHMLASIGDVRVIEIFAQVIEDLVRGELMQLGLAKEPEARFQEYILKSEAKTASLLARSCHSVAVLAGGDQNTETCAREYGRHLGIAFQLIDDVLDVVQSSAAMGKETSVDLKLGLATAPVLFASEQFEELVPMMMRKFGNEGDVERAHEYILRSDGVERTRMLADDHIRDAVRHAEQLHQQEPIETLCAIARKVVSRNK